MKDFLKMWLYFGLMYTVCMLLAPPLYWLVKWEAPSFADIAVMAGVRLLAALWVFAAFGVWWVTRGIE